MKKKVFMSAIAIVVGLLMSGVGFAWWGGMGFAPGTNIDNVKNFQKDTLNARDELAVKQLELQTEYSKTEPDTSRTAALEKEITDLRTTIRTATAKYGLNTGWMGRRMGNATVACNNMIAGGGHGMGYGMGYGMMGHGMMMGPGDRDGYTCPSYW